jgi:cytochrome c-type biogenesis protein CcmF
VALTTWGVSTFVLVIIAVEFWKGTRARARIEGEGPVVAFYHLVTRNRRRWGGYIVHIGIVMVFLGISGSAYNQDVRQHVEPGQSIQIKSPWGHTFTLTYQGLSTSDSEGQRNLAWQAIALVSVKENGKDVGNMTAEKRQYLTTQQPMSEVGIRSTVGEDLYLILSAMDNPSAALQANPQAQGVDLQVLIKPLVGWIWFGGLVMALGSIIAMWPSAERKRFEEEDAAPEAVVAGASS